MKRMPQHEHTWLHKQTLLLAPGCNFYNSVKPFQL